jgi:hypothetical protein
MAEKFVIRDTDESKARMIMEPHFLARLRRIKAVWNAFRFLARGGRFKVYLDFSGIDPRVLKPVKVTIGHDGRVLDLERERHNAVAGSMARLARLAGLELARDDEPGFRVTWGDRSRTEAWEEAGFDVAQTPTVFVVTPKGVDNA